MDRLKQIFFVLPILLLCWYGMMAAHELGHVLGAIFTGGTVSQVVLHPLTISRTDVSPNPYPAIVVWAGPIVGCLLPVGLWLVPWRNMSAAKTIEFFAGFCLIANGAYIGLGAFDAIGDCREMLRTGTPQWAMVVFGVVAVCAGLLIWHRLGSFRQFWSDPSLVKSRWAWSSWLVLVTYFVVAGLLSARG